MKKAIALLSVLFVLSGCSQHITDFSVLSNKNIELDGVDLDNAPRQKYISGKDSKWMFLFFPLGIPKVKEALNDALLKGDGDLLIDASVYYNSWWFLIGQSEIELKGTVVNTKGE
jgi:hypothetical protein